MTKKTKHHDNPDPVFDDTGPSSSQTPYLVPADAGVQIELLLSVGDQVGDKEAPAELAGSPGAWSASRTDWEHSTTATGP